MVDLLTIKISTFSPSLELSKNALIKSMHTSNGQVQNKNIAVQIVNWEIPLDLHVPHAQHHAGRQGEE